MRKDKSTQTMDGSGRPSASPAGTIAEAPIPIEILTDEVLLPVLMTPVARRVAKAIPLDVRKSCRLPGGAAYTDFKSEPDRQKFLDEFVRWKLDWLACFEYRVWLNGRMPFVSARELQIWRLRQLAEHLWDWDLPDDEVLALVFNLTPRQASAMVSSFYAKFRKIYVFPRIVRRLFDLVSGNSTPPPQQIREGGIDGTVFQVPSRRYVDEMNVLIAELRERQPRAVFPAAQIFRKNRQLMWVSEDVVLALKDPTTQAEILALYPIGGEQDE
jgi:hypothetical protein